MARTAICNLILGKKHYFFYVNNAVQQRLMSCVEQNMNTHVVLRIDLLNPFLPQQEVHLQRFTATSEWWPAGLLRDSEVLLTAVCIYPSSRLLVEFPLWSASMSKDCWFQFGQTPQVLLLWLHGDTFLDPLTQNMKQNDDVDKPSAFNCK